MLGWEGNSEIHKVFCQEDPEDERGDCISVGSWPSEFLGLGQEVLGLDQRIADCSIDYMLSWTCCY